MAQSEKCFYTIMRTQFNHGANVKNLDVEEMLVMPVWKGKI